MITFEESMCRLQNIVMPDYQESLTTGHTDRRRKKWSLCAAMLRRLHKNDYFKIISWCSCWLCNPPPPGIVLFYLQSLKGGCYSISDDLSCQFAILRPEMYTEIEICMVNILTREETWIELYHFHPSEQISISLLSKFGMCINIWT